MHKIRRFFDIRNATANLKPMTTEAPRLAEISRAYAIPRQLADHHIRKHGIETVASPEAFFTALLEGPRASGIRSWLSDPANRKTASRRLQTYKQIGQLRDCRTQCKKQLAYIAEHIAELTEKAKA
jgi:hypothetical protein